MDQVEFWIKMQALLKKYDLLHHPFYQDWTAGKLTIEDLREYAAEYYHHVSSFPTYLREFAARLGVGDLRQSILRNLWDELGVHRPEEGPHHLLWLDFAIGAGALPADVVARRPMPETISLIETFFIIARSATPAEALSTFYVYESQVPRVSREKAESLKRIYGLNEAACRYFVLHTTADVEHTKVWQQQIQRQLCANPKTAKPALAAAERAARALWRALDGINAKRRWRLSISKQQLN